MQVTITVTDPNMLRALADLMEGKTPSTAKATPASKPAAKPAKGKKAVEVVEEDEDVSFEDDEEETEAEEDESEELTFEDDEEETEEEVDEDEEEEEVKPSKSKSKPAANNKGSKAAAPASSAKAVSSKIKYEEVQAAFRTTHTKLEKKLKSKDKAVAKLNGLLKKFGAKSTRALDTTKYGAVLKELKALA